MTSRSVLAPECSAIGKYRENAQPITSIGGGSRVHPTAPPQGWPLADALPEGAELHELARRGGSA